MPVGTRPPSSEIDTAATMVRPSHHREANNRGAQARDTIWQARRDGCPRSTSVWETSGGLHPTTNHPPPHTGEPTTPTHTRNPETCSNHRNPPRWYAFVCVRFLLLFGGWGGGVLVVLNRGGWCELDTLAPCLTPRPYGRRVDLVGTDLPLSTHERRSRHEHED